MMKNYLQLISLLLISMGTAGTAIAAETTEDRIVSVAVLDFSVSKDQKEALGQEVSQLLAVSLSIADGMVLVEREALEKVLSEQQLGLSGAVNAATAARVGELTGAKILVSGRVINVGKNTILVAKVIGTETSRVLATKVSARNPDELEARVDELGHAVAKLVQTKSGELLAPEPDIENLVEKLKPLLAGKKLPAVSITIPEVHLGRAIPDPAAQTEITMLLKQLGFEVYEAGDSRVDTAVKGEAFSEFAGRYSGLHSCRARVEIEIKDLASGKLLWADRENAIGIDVAEHFAGKKALQKAGAELSERVVRKLIGE